jgi:hypothetical protein
MADFRKLIYALALVAMLAGLTIPASAQSQPFVCQTNGGVPPIIRAEGYTELVGDLLLNCTGGTPTTAGATVPQVNFQIFMNTGVTSRLLTLTGGWSEALLIIDEPHSAVNPTRPILNCGATGAIDNGPSGAGVCSITSAGTPAATYAGTAGSGTYGTGNPNVFQARWSASQSNALVWNGVPLDPPGSTTSRTLRFTNIRVDAEQFGLSSGFATISVIAQVSVSGTTSLSINNPSQTVAYVQQGLRTSVATATTPIPGGVVNFLQCNAQNALPIFGAFYTGTGQNLTQGGGLPTPTLKFTEGFATSWKTKNISYVINSGGNGTITSGAGYWKYNGTTYNTPADLNQNVPGAIYNTESAFENGSPALDPNPNPPQGTGTSTVTVGLGGAFSSTSTGIATAGIANAGTRLSVQVTNIPANSIVLIPQAISLYTGSSPTTGTITGVAVLTSTDNNGAGSISLPTAPSTGTYLSTYVTLPANGLAVYEVLWADPFSTENANVPMVVAYAYTSTSQAATGGPATQALGSFAPFYQTSSLIFPRAASSTSAVPRFNPNITGLTPSNIFTISKCSCNLLFPWAVSAGGFDTGIALANASKDDLGGPGVSLASTQTGPVQFWYYGGTFTGNGSGVQAAPPSTQCTNSTSPGTCPGTTNVPGGQVLTYVLSTGSSQWGLDARAAGFAGYIIAQASFQYCHAFAYISALGAGPTSNGISEGYVALLLDTTGGLGRTTNPSESLNH